MNLLEVIQGLCREKGITIMELERRAGIGNGTIGHWDRSHPRLNSLEKAAGVLGVPVSVLVDRIGRAEENSFHTATSV